MYDATQLIHAGAALYPRRLYEDEQATPRRSVMLAAKADWAAEYPDNPIGWMDRYGTVAHPAYSRAAGCVDIAMMTMREMPFATEAHRADAAYRAALVLVEKNIRVTEFAAVREVCRAAAT